jgi:hypothetical protein
MGLSQGLKQTWTSGAVVIDQYRGHLRLSGTRTTGIEYSGTINNAIDLSSLTIGTNTDGSLIKAGTFGSRLTFATASQYATCFYMNYSATSGTFRGMRMRIGQTATSGSASVDGMLVQVSAEASAVTSGALNAGFFEIIPKGTNTIGTARGVLINVDSAASLTYTNLYGEHIRFHTRGDETITLDTMLFLENEAVGGNGREVDAGIKIDDTNLSGGIIGYTAGLVTSGSFQRVWDCQPTFGTSTDGVIIRAGAGIGSSGLEFATASARAFAFYLRPTATSGTFKGMRLRSIADPASGSSLSIDNLHCQASIIASKNAATVNCGFFEIIPKGTNTVGTARCLLLNADSAASQTMTTQIIGHMRVHTRGDETITTDEMLRLENEAVGGNGRQLDSAIRIMETNISSGAAYGYAIDMGTGTSLLATGLLRIPDDGTVVVSAAVGGSQDRKIKITIGSTTYYIPCNTA